MMLQATTQGRGVREDACRLFGKCKQNSRSHHDSSLFSPVRTTMVIRSGRPSVTRANNTILEARIMSLTIKSTTCENCSERFFVDKLSSVEALSISQHKGMVKSFNSMKSIQLMFLCTMPMGILKSQRKVFSCRYPVAGLLKVFPDFPA